jgi:hypothetical protein
VNIAKRISASFLAMAIMVGSGLSNRALAEIPTWSRAGGGAEVSGQLTRETLQRFETGLRETPVIGFFDKISLKTQLGALIDGFRRYHRSGDQIERAKLERQFRALFRHTLDLLKTDKTGLYQEIAASRAGLWALMADRRKFVEIVASEGDAFSETRDSP